MDALDKMLEEFHKTPLKVEVGGADFRWKIIQIVSKTRNCDTVDGILREAQKMIDWINENRMLPL
jgi:hypothetical protein